MSAYRTYVTGQDGLMWYNPEIIELLKQRISPWWKMSWRYTSNWRILHIDGIEGCNADGKRAPGLPENLGKRIEFFHYKFSEGVCSTPDGSLKTP